jgi:hypothetical protein
MELGIKNNNVIGFTRRLFTITGYQSPKTLNREDNNCLWSMLPLTLTLDGTIIFKGFAQVATQRAEPK